MQCNQDFFPQASAGHQYPFYDSLPSYNSYNPMQQPGGSFNRLSYDQPFNPMQAYQPFQVPHSGLLQQVYIWSKPVILKLSSTYQSSFLHAINFRLFLKFFQDLKPFVSISFGNHTERTSVAFGGNPSWNEQIELDWEAGKNRLQSGFIGMDKEGTSDNDSFIF